MRWLENCFNPEEQKDSETKLRTSLRELEACAQSLYIVYIVYIIILY